LSCFCVKIKIRIIDTLKNNLKTMNWEEVFPDEAKRGFLVNFFLVFRMFLPYIIGLIVLRILFRFLKKK
jgi:hypothetical protein